MKPHFRRTLKCAEPNELFKSGLSGHSKKIWLLLYFLKWFTKMFADENSALAMFIMLADRLYNRNQIINYFIH